MKEFFIISVAIFCIWLFWYIAVTDYGKKRIKERFKNILRRKKMNKWHSVEERNPEKEGKILVKIENKIFVGNAYHHYCISLMEGENVYFMTGYGDNGWRYPNHFKKPSHWMYIPAIEAESVMPIK